MSLRSYYRGYCDAIDLNACNSSSPDYLTGYAQGMDQNLAEQGIETPLIVELNYQKCHDHDSRKTKA